MTFLIFFFLLTLVPIMWVNYVFKKNDKILPNMPFDGYELGEQLIKELKLRNVSIEKTQIGDHYDLEEKKVRVHEDRFKRKSLTSISVICHEIGHAIQHSQDYLPLITRTKLVKNTQWINKVNMTLIYAGLPIILATGLLSLIKLCIIIILLSTGVGIIVHLITLEVELDASFNKAYPIIKKKVPKVYHDACRSVLRAAAFSYVIGVFRNLISLRMIWSILSKIR